MTSTTVGIIMGSDSDWPVMRAAAEALDEFEVAFEVAVVSAHRTPQRMLAYAAEALNRRPASPESRASVRRRWLFKEAATCS